MFKEIIQKNPAVYNTAGFFLKEGLNDDKLDVFIKNLDNKLTDSIIDKIFSNTSEIDLMKIITTPMKTLNYLDRK